MSEKYKTTPEPKADTAPVAEYVHPVSARVLRVAPFLGYIPIFNITIRSFHPKFVFAICAQRLFEMGLANGLMRLSIQPMLTGRYGLTGTMYQRLSTLYTLGWAINAFITVVADTLAFCGYTKRWYSVVSAVGGGVFALLYALLPANESSAKPAAAFMFVTALFMSNIDVFAVALYSEQIRRRPSAGPALVSWMWGTAKVGIMISNVVQGPLSDSGLTHIGVYITSAIMFLSSMLFIFNLMEERRNSVARNEDARIEFLQHAAELASPDAKAPGEKDEKGGRLEVSGCVDAEDNGIIEGENDDGDGAQLQQQQQQQQTAAVLPKGFTPPHVDSYLCGVIEVNRDIITRQWKMAVFCLILTLGVVVNAVVNILGSRWDVLYSAAVVAVVVCGSAFFTLPLTISKAVVFMYFNSILYLNLPGVLNTFYVAKPSCLPDGPHFSYTFYNCMNGILGNIASLAGAAAFTHLCPKRSYRFVMSLSAILLPLASMTDLIIVKRWNTHIGIPDHAMYIFGDAIILDLVEMLLNMPTMMLMCRIAPRGSESMVFALLASIYHLSTSTSSAIGYILMDTIWPVVTKGECDYHNAPWLLIAGHIVAPIFIFPLAYMLLPASRICDNIDQSGKKVKEVVFSELSSTTADDPHDDANNRGTK
ncbi:biopterin transporter putative (BT1) [Leptomonas pyrrhocoris]|uniref:Biopterin transporter putative (BT1) n=1 Tax=Leptomonas pyrrhocoris TaxID=157538 RepID=A0A0N0E0N4_LEPPY|nr:biopterin transporter putative (BT1) [Leptomonas pyrrhocoris]XP_015665091.1 biopterin transporter putative (BT1) [Leptomonas pyrrhocoris]KPA86651.1 biopterin transporter putative (BT1) [Leptomonas pyrrhocoris]KPA86652.1 biopterin transporter putative (BT1) [Leptomonas pyrrhocoris]|eukprot:XP_015665090.1 biopterin transporter putative (BT1) [Leptomonas pyrrhocoris]